MCQVTEEHAAVKGRKTQYESDIKVTQAMQVTKITQVTTVTQAITQCLR